MRKEVKELLENNMLIEDLRNDLSEIVDIKERIGYLNDLIGCLYVLVEEEYKDYFEVRKEDE